MMLPVTIAGTMHKAQIVSEEIRAFPSEPGYMVAPMTFTDFRVACGRFGLMSTVNFRRLMQENANHMRHCEACLAEGDGA